MVGSGLEVLPIINIQDVPLGHLSNHILRLTGPKLDKAEFISTALNSSGALTNLNIKPDTNLLIISSENQNTGTDQNLFLLNSYGNVSDVRHVCIFKGNNMDIDLWTVNNFEPILIETLV